MDLFNSEAVTNVLPYDGDAKYYGRVLKLQPARDYMQHLLHDIEWRNDELVMYGKHILMQRKIAWYAEQQYDYMYSNTVKQSKVWTPQLLELKQLVEATSGHTFNSVLLNLYHNGQEGLSWHSDNERTMGEQVIASLSFGSERIFAFKHKTTKQRVDVLLENGGLLVMAGQTQRHWLHSVPKTKKVTLPRINLTFRTYTPVTPD